MRLCTWLVAVLLLLLLSVLNTQSVSAIAQKLPPSGLPSTSHAYTLQVEQLPPDADTPGATPVLVSAVEESSMALRLRPGHTCTTGEWEAGEGIGATLADAAGDANDITFDNNFQPLWYHALRRRGFGNIEWSGCGGKWRPEWMASDSPSTHNDTLSAVKHALSHHVVCSFSSVSFCGNARRRSPESQFQWAAQFISTLTSSPLSWRSNTPRHIRPTGVLVVAQPLNDSVLAANPHYADGGDGRPLRAPQHLPGVIKTEALHELEEETRKWCSYHVMYHDTLCTQHISPVLNGGRSGSGVQENLPPGLFKAVVPSLPLLFGTPFHQFHFRARQTCQGENTVMLNMTMRMSLVLRRAEEVDAVARHWSHELPLLEAQAAQARHNAFHVVVGAAGVPPVLQHALARLEAASSLQNHTRVRSAGGDPTWTEGAPLGHAKEDDAGSAHEQSWTPEVRYTVAMAGKDHGFYTLEIVPAAVLSAALNVPHRWDGAQTVPPSTVGNMTSTGPKASDAVWRVGDVVRSFVLLPLHLLRPEIHTIESLQGVTVLEKAHVDTSANTIALVLRTTLTEAHLAAYDAAFYATQHQAGADSTPQAGVLLARFPLEHGWAGSRDAPRDADSFRAVPQPIVSLTRCRAAHDRACDDCAAAAAAHGTVDHSDAVASIMAILPSTHLARDSVAPSTPPTATAGDGETCGVTWLRSTMVSGTYIPAPDPAMLFNAFALGLVGFTLGIGAIARSLNLLFAREKDRASLLGTDYESEWRWRHAWRRSMASQSASEDKA